ncbi:MAG: hypothetical protein U0637_02355 [Phycisphaerales bacterium]
MSDQNVPNHPNHPDQPAGLRALERALTNLRHAIRVHLFVQRGAALAAWAIGSGVLVGVLDYFLRMPGPLRMVLWVVGAVTVLLAVRRNLGPLTAFRPSLTDLALRVEQSEAGRRNRWQGLLASGLELGARSTPLSPGLEDQLASSAAHLTSTRFLAGSLSIPGLLDNSRLRKALTKCMVVLLAIAVLGVWQPALMRIGTQRVVLPWIDTPWPKRTGVVAVDTPRAHPLGAVFPLRAILTKSSRSADQTRVVVNYRVINGPVASEVQRALLTPQGRRAQASQPETALGAPPVEGDLFEQMLDTQRLADLAAAAGAKAGPEFELEYWFETSDDQTTPARVRMVEPPRIADATITVTPPAYAASLAAGAGLVSGERDAGDGLDDRAAVGPILAGSRVQVRLSLSKDVPVPAEGTDPAPWLAAVAPALAALPGAQATITPRQITVSFDAGQSVRAGVTLTDAYQITSREPAVFRLDVVEDHPASASVIEPAQDESVLATAVIPAAGEGRDDLGVAWVSLRSQVARTPPDSVGAAPEAAGEPAEVARTDTKSAPATSARADAPLDLAELTLKPGDEVWLSAQVADVLAADQGADREPVVSGVRRLRIISESELVEQFRAELASLRDAARQMEVEQNALTQQRAESAAAHDQPAGPSTREAAQDLAREQARREQTIAQRLTPFEKSLERLADRAHRNNLADEPLKGLLEDAKQGAGDARDAASQASQALDEDARTEQAPRQEQLSREIAQQQARAADELSALARMLSQGEDQWAVRRSLEKLLTEQKQLRAQTAAAGESSQGKDAKDLTREQREDLERLARKQQDLSQQAAQALDTLEQRAQQMQEADSAQARAMQQAASGARQKQLVQKQNNAGQSLRQNQTGQAQQQQKQAEEAIEEALENLDKAQQQQDEKLRRVLADIVESLQRLVDQQQGELSRLAKAQEGEQQPALDKGMMGVHQNTLGVLKKVRDEVKDPGQLPALLDGAQQSQSSAVSVLRQSSPDLADADEMERLSLQRLSDALAEAQKQNEDAQAKAQEQARAELRKAYRELLELEVVLKAETDPLIESDTGRRTRQALRELGRRQTDVRARMDELHKKSEALAEARVFDYAHTRFDNATLEAGKDLDSGKGTRAVQRHQAAAVAILQSLVEALKEDKKKGDELEDEDGGGGGGGSSGGGKKATIPPYAELVLLRGMQAEAAARTRALSEQGSEAAEVQDVSALQQELSRQGQDLLDRMTRQGPTSVKPGPSPTPEPKTDTTPDSTPDSKPDPKPGSKPGSKPASTQEGNVQPTDQPNPTEAPKAQGGGT